MSEISILNAESTLDLDLAGFKLVEASAGTGKTYAIGNLYLRLLMDGYKVGEILVVTFTNAATEELRGRIRQRIYQALMHLEEAAKDDLFLQAWSDSFAGDHAKKDFYSRQLKLAVNSMDEAAIYTIHGFCQRALTEFAFNSRQAFDVEMISDDELIWQAAIRDWWRNQAYGLDQLSLSLFIDAAGSVDALIQLQRPLRKPGTRLVPTIDVTMAQLFSQWQMLAESFDQLAGLWHQEKEVVQTALYSEVLTRRKAIYKLDNLPALFELLDHYFSSGKLLVFPQELEALRASVLQQSLKNGKSEVAFGHRFFMLVDQLLDQHLRLQQQARIRVLADAHQWAEEEVGQRKRVAGQLSFDDQLILLERALAENPALGIQIQQRFPVAMIDEFQDTDATQYNIFRHIYHGRERGSLVMIGDPKQAIYSFRGGDIFTYIRARRDAKERYTLDTNWRSTPRLVGVVNRFFAKRPFPFIFEEIPFAAVHAAPKQHQLLRQLGEEVKPLTIWQLPPGEKGKALAKNAANPLMHAHTANEIARLIDGGQSGELRLGERPVRPGDIAVLVRNHFEANELRAALQQRGVAAVANTSEQVFQSDEAAGLQWLMAAVIDCRDAGLLRQAMASSLLNFDYIDIHDHLSHEQQWLEWGEHFQQLHAAWATKGFMAMFQQMLRRLETGDRLASRPDAARRLTNLMHLGELLQQASQSIHGMEALLHWFEQQVNQSNKEAELRLENEGDLVRIVTIHSSKGLEYPIVFLPYMWSCKPRKAGRELLTFFDQESGCHCLDAAGDATHLLMAEKERLAEDIRLAYVALTRACAKIYLAWGHAGNAPETALGWLLHPVQMPDDLSQVAPQAFKSTTEIEPALAGLAAAGDVEVMVLPSAMPQPYRLAAPMVAATCCTVAPFTGTIATDWRITSFSSMTRDVHQLSAGVEREESDDPVFAFPAGTRTGLFLHALFESIDFQHDSDSQVMEFSLREAPRYGLDPALAPVIRQWVSQLLATTLDAAGLTLGQIGKGQRLSELSFDFPARKISFSQLNRLLDEVAGQAVQPLKAEDCSGFINGVIDLVFEHQGRYYLADYKSNHLGYSLEAYAPAALRQCVLERRYDLQYLIYSIALNRYLRLRVPDYSYEQHFGGVYYLFLRGMRRSHGHRYGVWFERPALSLIQRLDDIFNAGGEHGHA